MRRSTTLITIITARKPNASIQQSSIILFDTTGTQSKFLMTQCLKPMAVVPSVTSQVLMIHHRICYWKGQRHQMQQARATTTMFYCSEAPPDDKTCHSPNGYVSTVDEVLIESSWSKLQKGIPCFSYFGRSVHLIQTCCTNWHVTEPFYQLLST